MTTIRYNELLDDRNVFKANHELDFRCISGCKRYSIGVYYNPSDFVSTESNSILNKPFLGVYPSSHNMPTIPLIESEKIFLMFSEFFEKAFTYRLTFDCERGEAFLKVLDMPNINDGIVSMNEVNGISKAIHPDHIKFLAPKAIGSFGY